MRVELLFTEDDPSVMPTRQNLAEVLGEDAFETAIQLIAVASLADAELLEFPGSPTIRIDGVDIEPGSASTLGLGRRTYRQTDGSSSGVPDKALIRRAVERARGWGHGRR